MKKNLKLFVALALAVMMLAAGIGCAGNTSSNNESTPAAKKVIVQTNAFFAPFEYYEGTKIVGVDVDIMTLVGEKLNAEIEFVNVEFSAIIDNVSRGVVCDCGAAGITVTDARLEKVDFSTPYYTSVQYVIYKADDASIKTEDGGYILWDSLAGLGIGVQTDTTGWIFTDGEINGTADNDYGYDGVLYDTDTELKMYDNAQLAADAIGANQIDVVIIDELPAKYIVEKNSQYVCLPLYYAGADGEEDSPTEEQYAICVTKGNTELMTAINAVLADLLKEDASGVTGIEKLVMKHMGLED